MAKLSKYNIDKYFMLGNVRDQRDVIETAKITVNPTDTMTNL